MGMAAGSGKGGIKSEINVTPLVDVVLVLLIIFMVVTPMLQRGKEINLPKAQRSEKEKKGLEPLVLSITRSKQVFLDKDLVTEGALQDRLHRELVSRPEVSVLLKGDEALEFGIVRKTMDTVRAAGAKNVSLGVQELKSSGSERR